MSSGLLSGGLAGDGDEDDWPGTGAGGRVTTQSSPAALAAAGAGSSLERPVAVIRSLSERSSTRRGPRRVTSPGVSWE